MHTEDTAKQLWCPMVRFAIGPETSKWQGVAYTNRCDELNHNKVTCIASGCALWRWRQVVEQKCWLCREALATEEPERPEDVPADWLFVPVSETKDMPAHWVEPGEKVRALWTGFCGLGGRP